MSAADGSNRYSSTSIILHWLMLALMVGVYAVIELREFYPRGSAPREALKMWHYALGLSVFGLVWLRIAARLIWPAPAPLEGGWRNVASKIMHAALYILMIAMPLAGWVILSAEGDAVALFGFALPPLVGESRALAERVEELHELGGTIGYWLIAIHAAASLFHHYVLRDHIFRRMLPSRA